MRDDKQEPVGDTPGGTPNVPGMHQVGETPSEEDGVPLSQTAWILTGLSLLIYALFLAHDGAHAVHYGLGQMVDAGLILVVVSICNGIMTD